MKTPKNPNIVEKFQCGSCERLHNEEWDAERCCLPEVDEVYQCRICEEIFEWQDEAEKHINDKRAEEDTTDDDLIRDGVPAIDRWWVAQCKKGLTPIEMENLKILGMSIV